MAVVWMWVGGIAAIAVRELFAERAHRKWMREHKQWKADTRAWYSATYGTKVDPDAGIPTESRWR